MVPEFLKWNSTHGYTAVMDFVQQLLMSDVFVFGVAAVVAAVLVGRILVLVRNTFSPDELRAYDAGYQGGQLVARDEGPDPEYAPDAFGWGFRDGYEDEQKALWDAFVTGLAPDQAADLVSDGYGEGVMS